jgi:quercetin dioxygenase-like cupin family protein
MRQRGIASVAIALVVGLALAGTAIAGGRITVKTIGAFGVGSEVGYPAGHVFSAAIAPGSAVATVLVRVPPGGTFPWHYHTAPLTVTVTAGTITLQDALSCATQSFAAGSGFVEEPNVIHRAMNTSATEAKIYVTYLGIAPGTPPDVYEAPSYAPC